MHPRVHPRLVCLWLVGALSAQAGEPAAAPADWPCFMGPARNGVVVRGGFGGNCTAYSITPEKAEQLWTAPTNEGDHGGSSPIIHGEHVYLWGRAYERNILSVFELRTGKRLLNQTSPDRRSCGTTPVLADGKLFGYQGDKLSAVSARADKYECLGVCA